MRLRSSIVCSAPAAQRFPSRWCSFVVPETRADVRGQHAVQHRVPACHGAGHRAGALALSVAAWATGNGTGTPSLLDFRIALACMGVLCLPSLIEMTRLTLLRATRSG